MSVDYADKTNPSVVTHGEDRIEYGYDRFGRLTTVNDGASEPIEYKYAVGEPDLRHQLDNRTAQITLVKQDDSLNTTLYTRTLITPWPHIQWDEKLGVLSLVNGNGIIPPDTAVQSADKRRRLYNALETLKSSQLAFDKPSNSFVLPPEFQTVNCDPGACGFYFLEMDGDDSLYVGQTGSYDVISSETFSCEPWYQFRVGNQYGSTWFGRNYSGLQQVIFDYPGPHSVDVYGDCKCTIEDDCALPGCNYIQPTNLFAPLNALPINNALPGTVGHASMAVNVLPPKVTIQSADITQDSISVRLVPNNVSGTFTLVLVQADGSSTYLLSQGTKSGGTHSFHFTMNNLPDNTTFHHVRATWTVRQTTVQTQFQHKFKILGDYRHSQYNTPSQNGTDCGADGDSRSYVTTETLGISQCFNPGATYRTLDLPIRFKDRVVLNGSGNTSLYGAVQWDQFCQSVSNAPSDAIENTFRDKTAITPGCGASYALGNSTVAARPNNPNLSCGDQVYIQGFGIKTVTDYCPVCTDTQLDNYTSTETGCNIFTDLTASAKTIKLLP
ncbi:MAG: hypothetical protein HRT35_14300 [Algicola sp.]|nr:hypothetical protein [Algicola sp.]